jgi:hypothetical protein
MEGTGITRRRPPPFKCWRLLFRAEFPPLEASRPAPPMKRTPGNRASTKGLKLVVG